MLVESLANIDDPQQEIEHEENLSAESMSDNENMTNVKSSASCYVSNITGFMIGAQSSRFWMLRKHVNCLSPVEVNNLPFKSWNFITLQLHHRDVDLVIPDDTQMKVLIKFLVYRLKTVDGVRGSAQSLLNLMNERGIKEFLDKTKRT